MAVRNDFSSGEVLTAADLNDTFASKVDYATPTNAQTGTAYTFVADDAERLTTASNGSAVTFTIPPQSAVTWGDDTILRVVNYGAGALTVAGGSGVTVTNTASTLSQYQAGAAIRTGSDAWTLVPFGESKFEATGGNEVSTVGGYRYHLFTSTSTFVVTSGQGDVEIVVVGGGGGAGSGSGTLGGGGAGGAAIEPSSGYSTQTLSAGSYTVTIGAKGLGSTSNADGAQGGSSSFAGTSTITALGGGGGGGATDPPGGTGGSGGGGAGSPGSLGGSASGSNTNVGGAGKTAIPWGGGGGGGATAVGGTGTDNGGNGGQGLTLTNLDANLTAANFPTTFTGITVISSGGGGGALSGNSAGTGGTGAGNGGSNASGSNATSYGSGGGGGGGGSGKDGGDGFAGLVVVRYAV